MEKEIGKIIHFFEKPMVAVISLEEEIKVGNTIHIKGNTSDFIQKIESMQVNHESVENAKSGDDIGLKVHERVRKNDKVFLTED